VSAAPFGFPRHLIAEDFRKQEDSLRDKYKNPQVQKLAPGDWVTKQKINCGRVAARGLS